MSRLIALRNFPRRASSAMFSSNSAMVGVRSVGQINIDYDAKPTKFSTNPLNRSSGTRNMSILPRLASYNLGSNGLSKTTPFPYHKGSIRNFSATPDKDVVDTVVNSGISDSVAEGSTIFDSTVRVLTDSSDVAAAVVASEHGNFAIRHTMALMDNIHTFTGLPYWEVIILTTIGLRVFLLPIAITSIQNSMRMSHLRPDLMRVSELMKNDPNAGDMKTRMRYEQEMRALFVKHKVNPLRAMMLPFFQLPIFLLFFFSLQNMGIYYPDFTTGGTLWFTDLSVPDNSGYYILPLFNSLSFLMMIEMGSDGMDSSNMGQFKTIMRGLAVLMVPLTASLPQGVFMYWGASNVFSLIQTFILKIDGVRMALNIPKPLKQDPAVPLKVANPFKKVYEIIDKEKTTSENAKAEILDGVSVPKPPSAPDGSAPKTFTAPPKKTK